MMSNDCTPGHTDGADHLTILLVASDVTLLKLMEMALKLEFACTILAFTAAKSALEAAKTVMPDLVVIHFDLLDLDALELADRLHDIKGFESVPMLLTYMPFAFWNMALRSYLFILNMPFVWEEFYAAVYTCLNRTRSS
jgi:DNA-binding NtrC family response regulator